MGKLDVTIEKVSAAGSRCVAMIAFGGGFTLEGYTFDNQRVDVLYHSFYYVLFQHLKTLKAFEGAVFDVDATCATIAWTLPAEQVPAVLESAVRAIGGMRIGKADFKRAKNGALQGLERNYKDEAFRATYKCYEYLHANKGFPSAHTWHPSRRSPSTTSASRGTTCWWRTTAPCMFWAISTKAA